VTSPPSGTTAAPYGARKLTSTYDGLTAIAMHWRPFGPEAGHLHIEGQRASRRVASLASFFGSLTTQSEVPQEDEAGDTNSAGTRWVRSMHHMNKQLPIPPEALKADGSAEMIRVWIANNALHVSLNLGMWQNAEDSDVDERVAWGFLLADLTRHIANGMMQEYGWDYDETRNRIRSSFLHNFDEKDGNVTGTFRK
jgi:hypothetical protein